MSNVESDSTDVTVIESMLTTIDNPYDPFDQYDDWLSYDLRTGHNTNGYLARIVVTSDELSEADQAARVEAAIDEIIHENVNGMYRKVSRETRSTS